MFPFKWDQIFEYLLFLETGYLHKKVKKKYLLASASPHHHFKDVVFMLTS